MMPVPMVSAKNVTQRGGLKGAKQDRTTFNESISTFLGRNNVLTPLSCLSLELRQRQFAVGAAWHLSLSTLDLKPEDSN